MGAAACAGVPSPNRIRAAPAIPPVSTLRRVKSVMAFLPSLIVCSQHTYSGRQSIIALPAENNSPVAVAGALQLARPLGLRPKLRDKIRSCDTCRRPGCEAPSLRANAPPALGLARQRPAIA